VRQVSASDSDSRGINDDLISRGSGVDLYVASANIAPHVALRRRLRAIRVGAVRSMAVARKLRLQQCYCNLSTRLAQIVERQARALSWRQNSSPLQIGQSEIHVAISIP
jgi:hypothetical protein